MTSNEENLLTHQTQLVFGLLKTNTQSIRPWVLVTNYERGGNTIIFNKDYKK